MKVWLVRAVVVTFIASGIITLSLFFCTRVLERGPIANRLEHDCMRELTLAGELLVQLLQHAHGSPTAKLAELDDLGGERVSYLLFDEGMHLLLGDPADTQLISMALQARDSNDLVGGVPMFGRDDSSRNVRAMPFVARDGKTYYVASAVQRQAALPDIDMFLWIGVRILGVVMATVILVALVRERERPAREMRKAMRRFARGEYDARITLDKGHRGDELAKLAYEFNAMAEHMCHLYAEQQRLFGEISHEMRSPLSRMSLAVELAGRSDAAEKDRLLVRIRRDAERLGLLTNEMMELARYQRVRARDELVDFGELVRQVVTESEFEAESQGKRISLHRMPMDMPVQGAREPLFRMVENVVRNAIRHTPEGSCVAVHVDPADRLGQMMAVIRVVDAGPGVAEDELQNIFKPFVRGRSSEGMEGKGLGLAITRHVALRHGGNVHGENLEEGGFMVTIRLPLDSSVKAAAGESAQLALRAQHA